VPNERATWFHSPKGAKIHPLIYGDTLKADRIAIHESPWDAITQIDKLNIDPFATAGWSIVSTRGASNAKTLAEIDMGLGSDIYLFPQNPKSGSDGLRLF